jgi:hypothetical protein
VFICGSIFRSRDGGRILAASPGAEFASKLATENPHEN